MKQLEESKLTEEVKLSKTSSVIPSLPALSPSNVSRDLKKAAEILKSGGVVVFPTDTVYGIGCRYDDKKAVDRIYQIKGTPKSQPFPFLVSSVKQVEALAEIPDIARDLMQKYWPGGLTIILPRLSTYSNPGLEELDKPGLEREKIGFRMPNHKGLLSMIDIVGVPIIGTSANLHVLPVVKSFKELEPEIIKKADFVIRGECPGGQESTVVDTTVEPPKILRQGAITLIL